MGHTADAALQRDGRRPGSARLHVLLHRPVRRVRPLASQRRHRLPRPPLLPPVTVTDTRQPPPPLLNKRRRYFWLQKKSTNKKLLGGATSSMMSLSSLITSTLWFCFVLLSVENVAIARTFVVSRVCQSYFVSWFKLKLISI